MTYNKKALRAAALLYRDLYDHIEQSNTTIEYREYKKRQASSMFDCIVEQILNPMTLPSLDQLSSAIHTGIDDKTRSDEIAFFVIQYLRRLNENQNKEERP